MHLSEMLKRGDRAKLSKRGVYTMIGRWHRQRGLEDKHTNRQGTIVGSGGMDQYVWVYIIWDGTESRKALAEDYLEKVV